MDSARAKHISHDDIQQIRKKQREREREAKNVALYI